MARSRMIDQREQEAVSSGVAYFHVASAGHESMAVLGGFLGQQDWLYCHYRDRALLLARGIQTGTFFQALYATGESPSMGRQMNAHMCHPELNVTSIVGPVGNHALHAVGTAQELKSGSDPGIVLCSMGDGTSQQGEVLEAIAEAVRSCAPVLFVVENNDYSISTRTQGQTFYSHPTGDPDEYYGLALNRIDGRNAVSSHQDFERIVNSVRSTQRPALAVIDVPRLSDHTNADDQTAYRSPIELGSQLTENDPILWLIAGLESAGVQKDALLKIVESIEHDVRAAEAAARKSESPEVRSQTKAPLPASISSEVSEYLGNAEDPNRLTMRQAIMEVLAIHLQQDERVSLFGEDIEDPKGDVFGLTRGLSTRFPGRVCNSALSESTILGVSIGRALAGGRPVAFLQFADFLPLAMNQICAELGTMYWRTAGSLQCPVIVMVSCGGYKPGLGPFHSQTLESLATNIPGVDVMMPSSASDAAGLLNAAFKSGRPTLFFYPKACLNDQGTSTSSGDIAKHLALPGKARLLREGNAITMVCYGNSVSRCLYAADELSKPDYGIECDVIDLRCLAPWDASAVVRSVKKTGRLLVAHEDNRTGGFGAEVISTVMESVSSKVRVMRVTREDTYIPFNFQNQIEILPSNMRVLEAAVQLLDGSVAWSQPAERSQGAAVDVKAIGSSPTDETLIVCEWHVKPGQSVSVGDLVVSLEADKAVSEFLSSYEGRIDCLFAKEGETVDVGTPIFRVQTSGEQDAAERLDTQERPTVPVISGLPTTAGRESGHGSAGSPRMFGPVEVRLVGTGTALGDIEIHNPELATNWDERNPEEISSLTGIKTRHYATEKQGVCELAVQAAKNVLDDTAFPVNEIDLIVCSSATPEVNTPSLACQVMSSLAENEVKVSCPGLDISAACTGYLYGLRVIYDYFQQTDGGSALLITSEVLSRLVDKNDFDTAILFGDAATATLIQAGNRIDRGGLALFRPVISASTNGSDALTVPATRFSGETIAMQGSRLFSRGARTMANVLLDACRLHDLELNDLDLIIPHQANKRIIDAMASKLGVLDGRIYTNIDSVGNTSSSSIPLCLDELWNTFKGGESLGLAAFGGGITYGATVLHHQNL